MFVLRWYVLCRCGSVLACCSVLGRVVLCCEVFCADLCCVVFCCVVVCYDVDCVGLCRVVVLSLR